MFLFLGFIVFFTRMLKKYFHKDWSFWVFFFFWDKVACSLCWPFEFSDLEHLSHLPVPILKCLNYKFILRFVWCYDQTYSFRHARQVLLSSDLHPQPIRKLLMFFFLSSLGFLFNPLKYFNTIWRFIVARPYTADCSQYIQTANGNWNKPLFEASSCLTQLICFHAIVCGRCGLLWSSSTNYKKFTAYYKKAWYYRTQRAWR